MTVIFQEKQMCRNLVSHIIKKVNNLGFFKLLLKQTRHLFCCNGNVLMSETK